MRITRHSEQCQAQAHSWEAVKTDQWKARDGDHGINIVVSPLCADQNGAHGKQTDKQMKVRGVDSHRREAQCTRRRE